MSKLLKLFALTITTLTLGITFLACGFAVCLIPSTTTLLARAFATDEISPFTHEQLVCTAEAARDYAFGTHSLSSLYEQLYWINAELTEDMTAQGQRLAPDQPDISQVVDPKNTVEVTAAFKDASDRYVFSPNAISHLDDCYRIAFTAYPLLGAFFVLAVLGSIFCRYRYGTKTIGRLLVVSGRVILVIFVVLGVWAAINFSSFFTVFHALLFNAGSWTFSQDSLLICSLPLNFWIGMGTLWLAVTILVSILSILIGKTLMRKSMNRKRA